jgi:hypothetical protein
MVARSTTILNISIVREEAKKVESEEVTWRNCTNLINYAACKRADDKSVEPTEVRRRASSSKN